MFILRKKRSSCRTKLCFLKNAILFDAANQGYWKPDVHLELLLLQQVTAVSVQVFYRNLLAFGVQNSCIS